MKTLITNKTYKPDIVIGSDHAGFESKQMISNFLKAQGYIVEDVGCYNTNAVDYPDIAHHLCSEYIDTALYPFGILICGTGQGMSMAANKHCGVRAGIAWNKDIAKLLREHNDANVLCLPSYEKVIHDREDINNYTGIVHTFLTTPFSKVERHTRRIGNIKWEGSLQNKRII